MWKSIMSILSLLFISQSFVQPIEAVSYVCTYDQKDYYGHDSLAFQFPHLLFPDSKTDSCSKDCLPYEPMIVKGKQVWVGYQSLCRNYPEFLLLSNGSKEERDPVLTHNVRDGIYLSYPSTTVCISHQKEEPCTE